MAEQIRLTDTERKALDFLIAALKEDDDSTASLSDTDAAAFIGGIIRVTAKTINVTRRIAPVVLQTARVATQLVGRGAAAFTATGAESSLNDLRNRSLEDLLEELQRRSR